MTLRDHLALARVVPCSAAALQVPLGALHTSAAPAALARGAVTVWLVTAAATIYNDVRDVTADTVDRPWRPIPSGRVAPGAALGSTVVCAGTALLLAARDGSAALGVTTALLALSWAYSAHLKAMPLLGNATVAVLAGSPLLYGALLAAEVGARVLLGAALVGSYMLCYEVLKTLRDEHADRAAGCTTLTVRYGAQATVAVLRAAAALFSAVALLALPYASPGYGVLITLGAVLPLNGVAWLPGLGHRTRTGQRVLTLAWLPGPGAVALLV